MCLIFILSGAFATVAKSMGAVDAAVRNAQLRMLCGFDMFRQSPLPSAAAYSRFVTKLLDHQEEASALFSRLLDQVGEVLPEFGKILGVDGKAVSSRARKLSKDKNSGRWGENNAN